ARYFSGRSHRHTIIFISTTGEEIPGLPGSRWAVEHWDGPRPLAALTLVFVGAGRIFVAPFPASPALWARRLLAGAESELRTHRVLFDPWLVVVPRILDLPYGADHLSFLEAGIPAFNLSCEFPAWTYHTTEDRASHVSPETLAATLELVTRMLEILDRDPASARGADSSYVPVKVGRVFLVRGRVIKWVAAATLALLAIRLAAG